MLAVSLGKVRLDFLFLSFLFTQTRNHVSHTLSIYTTFSGNAASALSLASMFRNDSSTGLSALRMQDGLNQRNTSVDDFLSLVTSGDIPHQDPLLSVPLIQQQQHQGSTENQSSATLLAQKQLMAQATASGNTALANALRSGSLSTLRGSSDSSSALKRKLQDLETNGIETQGASKR